MSATTQQRELADKLAAKRKSLMEVFDSKPDMKFSETELHEIQSLKAEIDDLGEQKQSIDTLVELDAKNRAAVEDADRVEKGWPHPSEPLKAGDHVAPDRLRNGYKSFGQMFVESEAFTEYRNKRGPEVNLDGAGWALNSYFGQKHLLGAMQKDAFGTDDWPYAYPHQAGMLEHLHLTPVVADLMPQGETTQNEISFVREDAFTNNADFVAERGEYPESELSFSPDSEKVSKIATYIPVTDEQMADLPMMRSIIDARLRTFLALKEDHALLHGLGTGSEFTGLYNVPGIQTQAQGVDEPITDTLFKAITKVETAFMSPNGIIMHPLDWQEIQLMRSADGHYIWGTPADPSPRRIWGLPVVSTQQATQGTPLVGAFNAASQVFRRAGVSIEVSNSHADFFIHGQLAVRADTRLALVVYRPTGICEVTTNGD